MRKVIKILVSTLFTILFPFVILTLSYHTQNFYSGGWQDFYQFLLIILGVFGTIGMSVLVMLAIDETI